MHAAIRFVSSLIFASACCVVATAACNAQATPSPSPSPSASPSASPASPSGSPAASAAPSPNPGATEGPLYPIAGDIYSIDRLTTAYYYFQSNKDGSAKVKQEFRYGRNLWGKNAQVVARFPIITRFPKNGGAPFSGFGNFELGYSYSTKHPTFDHYLEIRAAFPTEGNGVETQDTQLKGFYNLKWKWPNWAINYSNEYDQTIFIQPGPSWTSYYEGKLTLPDFSPVHSRPSFKISAIYNYRVLFDSGGIWKGAAGITAFGGFNGMALSLIDTWGIGEHGLWRYKFEANFTARW